MADTEEDFNSIDWLAQEQADNDALQSLLAGAQEPGNDGALFDTDRPLDLGEKADDAEDFEDISDDDLPDEEPVGGSKEEDAPGLVSDDQMNDNDDLFGDDDDDIPADDILVEEHTTPNGTDVHRINGGLTLPSSEPSTEDLMALNFPSTKEATTEDESHTEEEFKKAFPAFEKGGNLYWHTLLVPKTAYFVPLAPAKPPKPLPPTKLSLDLLPDQEKQFRTAAPAFTDKRKLIAEAEARGIVIIEDEESEKEDLDAVIDYAPIDPEERIGGFNMMDIGIACTNWEEKIEEANRYAEEAALQAQKEAEEELDEWDREFLGHSSKRKRKVEPEFEIKPYYPLPNFDNFLQLTEQIGKRVVLDLNDPHLLLDISYANPAEKRQRTVGGPLKRSGNGSIASILQARFNLSNDEAYDALKENHQTKVRASLASVDVEHSMPALKLQWPYYRTKLYAKDARSFHRPSLKFQQFLGRTIVFEKAGMRKKKTLKNLSTQEIFATTKDLSLSDHYATATLFEYSEEHPTVLSNFGMGNRVINYYRRKDQDDPERPVPEDRIGDVNVLLPNDKSPFANFGMVDPGETVRTLHNGMFRAPIFKHEPLSTDFLVVRTTTGISGSQWHIRNIDNLFVVGQQLPSTEVPGPHSRKVTNAAKNRLKMVAWRKMRKNDKGHLKIGDITAHIQDSSDMQNRQKLKEFLSYDKVNKVWGMKAGETLPDEPYIRAKIKPEDVCLIDAMQVGARHLEDAGLVIQEKDEDKPDDDEMVDEDDSNNLEQHLAPWKTSKAFLDAASDKAMVRLHGPGDPSGCGLAFSFIKTSMKGGYLEAIQNGPHSNKAVRMAMDSKQNGGHGYNVKTQQEFYNKAIREIWEKQKANLTDQEVHEYDVRDKEDDNLQVAATPATFDDNASVFSTEHSGRAMRITRMKRNKYGQLSEEIEMVKDPKVWHQYEKRKIEQEMARTK